MVGRRRVKGNPLGRVLTVQRRRAHFTARAGRGGWPTRLAAAADHLRAALRDLERRDPVAAEQAADPVIRLVETAAADLDRRQRKGR